ncbi:MAG: hypothetical protein WCG83_05485 [Candidatus Peregrinibacteria bacterium]
MQQKFLLTISTIAIFLTSCGTPLPPPLALPQGDQMYSGTLLPSSLDVLRRGSHLLRRTGVKECPIVPTLDCLYVESSTVNLRLLEGRPVSIIGVIERNNRPEDMFVLIAKVAHSLTTQTDAITFNSLGFFALIPELWIRQKTTGVDLAFSVSGSTLPLVSVKRMKADILPDGPPFVVDGRHAIRISDAATASENITVDLSDDFLVLHFNGLAAQDSDIARSQWSDFLSSIRFIMQTSSDVSSTTSVDGIPCGGVAGILCPTGQYCAITDAKLNIGRCMGGKQTKP